MDRRKKIAITAMLLVKNQQLIEGNLNIILLKLLHNLRNLHALASNNQRLLLELGSAVEHSDIRERQVWRFPRSIAFWECGVLTMDDKRFKEQFRVNRKAFKKVCEIVKGIERSDTNMRLCIPLDKRVAIALFALGSAAEYRAVSCLFGVGRSTVGEIVIEFCHAICNDGAHYINSYPPHPQEIEDIVDGFEQLGFPQCFGAVDGCHIEIEPKKEDAVDYYNYKGWYSVVLLSSCDHRCKFTYVHIGSSGRNNDSYIFESSALKQYHESTEIFTENSKVIGDINVPLLLIGDSAFRLSRYMMKPFPYSINQPELEKTFNYRLSRCRRVIENAFGQLKARFRRIGRGLQVAPKNVNVIINACCILHNFLKMQNDEVPPAWMENDKANLTTRSQPNHTTTAGNNDVAATTIRDAIALSFMDGVASEVFSTEESGDLSDGVDILASSSGDDAGSTSDNAWEAVSLEFS